MSSSNNSQNFKENRLLFTAELCRALTPTFIALLGGIIGFVALNMKGDASAFGLAGTAIAGAAGLAQSRQSNSAQDN